MSTSSENIELNEEQVVLRLADNFWKEIFEEHLSVDNYSEIKEDICAVIAHLEDLLIKKVDDYLEYNGIQDKSKCSCGNEISNPAHSVCLECWKNGKR